MKQYLDILKNILENGKVKPQRATLRDGTPLKVTSVSGAMFEHDMSDGFPLLTTKFVSLKTIAAELEFFIKGERSKKFLEDRKCRIWSEWCNPQLVTPGMTQEEKEKIDDLGRVYGVQWRDFGGKVDQLKNVIETLKKNPFDRRMLVMAWNPLELDQMALPPCHYGFQLLSNGETVDLLWNQRSVDTFIGLSYNIASYALLLLLIAKEVGMKPGKLIGFLADVHVYENHVEQATTQLSRTPGTLPDVRITGDASIFDWSFTEWEFTKPYNHQGKLAGEIAV